jgi:hypothetical protein
MFMQALPSPAWAQAQLVPPDRQRAELALLQTHVARCERDIGRWFALRCAVESAHQFFAARFVTTLALLLLVIGSLSLAT